MPQLTPYMLTTLLSATITLVMGICLLVVSVPREPELRNYRISRRILAVAYMALTGIGLCEVFGGNGSRMQTMAFTLIAASFQALLFTVSAITLVNMRYITARRIWGNIIPMSLLAAILLVALFEVPACFYPLFYAMLGIYCLQLTGYIGLFGREYRRYRRRFDNFFSGNEYHRLLWIRNSFFMVACLGIIVVALLFARRTVYMVFVVSYTVFYLYFAVKFINYASLFHRIAPAITAPEKERGESRAANGENTDETIERWLVSKEYLNPDITLEVLAARLNTNRTYISAYINSSRGMNFRQWISTLRIREAQRLMEANPGIPVPELAETVGISTQSSFSRQFRNVTGMTPGDFRRKVRKGDSGCDTATSRSY